VDRACGTNGRGKKRVQGFGETAVKKKTTERPRRRWEDGIKMGRREIGWEGGVWSGLTWLRIGTVGGLLWMRWWTSGVWRHGVSICDLFIDAIDGSLCRAKRTDEYEIICKDSIVAWFKILSQHLLGATEVNVENLRITGFQTGIWNRDLSRIRTFF
jgi:hypothetical protein